MTDIPEEPTDEQVQALVDACPQAAPIAEYVALLRRAVDLLATVDDAHHPWTHNEYMGQVDRLLLEIQPLLIDGLDTGRGVHE